MVTHPWLTQIWTNVLKVSQITWKQKTRLDVNSILFKTFKQFHESGDVARFFQLLHFQQICMKSCQYWPRWAERIDFTKQYCTSVLGLNVPSHSYYHLHYLIRQCQKVKNINYLCCIFVCLIAVNFQVVNRGVSF